MLAILLMGILLIGELISGGNQVTIISKQEIDNSLEYFRYRGFNSPHDAAMYVICKGFLDISIPNPQQIINYLDGLQSNDGSWSGYWTDMFTTHRVLLAYHFLNAKPALPMNQFFSNYDSLSDVINYIQNITKTDARDVYHITFGWILYYWQYPSWLPQFFTEIEKNLDWTTTQDFHKTTHILYNYVIARRPIPNLDGVINTTINLQNADGSWGDASRPVYYTSIEISLLTQILMLYPNHPRVLDIVTAIEKSRSWVENAYRTTVVSGYTLGYFGDILTIEASLFSGILSAGQNGLLQTNVDMTFQDIINRMSRAQNLLPLLFLMALILLE